MKKCELKEILVEAWGTGMRYIGVKIETEGSSQPEIIINPRENILAKDDYYMEAYDDDLILISAKGKKDIRIVGAAFGNTFADIEGQLMAAGRECRWKHLIADAIDRVYDRMIANTPPETAAEEARCENLREQTKTMFIRGDRTEIEARFICEHIAEYEELFDICMNGSDLMLKRGLAKMQRKLNAYIVQHENENIGEERKVDE